MLKVKNFIKFWGLVLCLFTLFAFFCTQGFAANDKAENELFLVAQKAFEDGFYDVAIRYINQFLQKFPNTEKNIQAQLLLGQCYFFKSQYLKAYEIFHNLKNFSEFKDATLFWLGETYFKGADYSQAKKHYQELIKLYPDSVYVPQAYYSLGWTFFEQGDYQASKKLFLMMVKLFPQHALSEDATFKVGECEHNLGNYETASKFYEQYILKYPKTNRLADAYFYIAEGNYYLENYLKAATFYAKAADVAYDHNINYLAKVSMGWCYLKLKRYNISQNYFNNALIIAREKNVLTDDVFLGQASLYTAMENNAKALAAYVQLIEKFPNSLRIGEAHLGKANIDYILKKYEDAISEYQWVIDNYRDDHKNENLLEKAYYGLAWTYLKSGQPDLSIKSFESIMNKTESKIVKVSALTQIGDAYHDNNELEKAIGIYDRILQDYPDSVYADYVQFRLGIALLKLDRIESATLSFQSLQSNFPTSKYLNDVKYYLGVAYFKKEDWSQAIHHTQEYLSGLTSTKMFSSEAHYILALSYYNLENYERALETFEDFVRSYPDQTAMIRIAELNAARCIYKLGRDVEALDLFQIIYKKYPNSEEAQEALLQLGDHYLESKEYDQSINYYKEFLDNFPGSDQAGLVYFELAQAYQVQGQLEKALSYYQLITDQMDEGLYAKAKLSIADIFSRNLDPLTAIETYRNIAVSAPVFKRDAYVKIAELFEANEDFEKAIEAYELAMSSEKALSEYESVALLFYIGEAYESLNNSERAVEAYLRIPYLYSQDTLWIIKAYLRIARIFEDEENWEDAKLTYSKIIDYQTEESKYAKERIEWLEENVNN